MGTIVGIIVVVVIVAIAFDRWATSSRRMEKLDRENEQLEYILRHTKDVDDE